jgi:hypothetical protein
MANQLQVIELHRKHPDWTSAQIAKRIDAAPAYVRATAYRKGLQLPGCKSSHPKPDGLIALGRAAREAGLTVDRIVELHRAGALRQ